MKRWLWLVVAALVALMLLTAPMRTLDGDERLLRSSEAVRKGDQLIEAGALVYRRVYLQTGGGSSRTASRNEACLQRGLGFDQLIETRFENLPPEDRERARAWFEASRLKQEVSRFNDTCGAAAGAFVIGTDPARGRYNELLRVNPYYFTYALPFRKTFHWRGALEFAGDEGKAVLVSDSGRRIMLDDAEDLVGATGMRIAEVAGGPQPVGRTLAAKKVELGFSGTGRDPAVRFFLVEGRVVAENRLERSSDAREVRLNGHRMPVGGRSFLEQGDSIYVSGEGRRETLVVAGSRAARPASTVRLRNGKPVRTEVREVAGLGYSLGPTNTGRPTGYLTRVVRRVDQAVSRLQSEELEDLDLRLTIDDLLQDRLSEELERFADTQRGEHAPKPGEFPAGITVMDAKTGAVRALASYPSPEGVSRRPSLDERTRRRLVRNQNLVNHPVGSATKPLFFAAVASQHPELMRLRIAGHDGEQELEADLFQCHLEAPYTLHASHRNLDFRKALEVSCNQYAIELATLALAASEGGRGSGLRRIVPESSISSWAPRQNETWVGPQALSYAPALESFVRMNRPWPPEEGAFRCDVMTDLARANFIDAAGRIAGVNTIFAEGAARRGGGREGRGMAAVQRLSLFDTTPWRGVLEQFSRYAPNRDAVANLEDSLKGLSPERVNLAANHVTSLRSHFVSMLLGGASGTWNNVQISESMARLVTNRRVESSFVQRLGRPGETVWSLDRQAGEYGKLGLEVDAHTAVLDGLRRVVEGSDGTARHLADELSALRERFAGDGIWVLGKTGTPALERRALSGRGRALRRLVAAGLVDFVRTSGQTSEIRLRADRTDRTRGEALLGSGAGQDPDRQVAVLRSALTDVGMRTLPQEEMTGTLASLNAFADMHRDLEEPTSESPLYLAGDEVAINSVHRIVVGEPVDERGAMFVFTLIHVPGAGGKELRPEFIHDPGTRAVTATIYLEANQSSPQAVTLAGRILEDLAVLLLPERSGES